MRINDDDKRRVANQIQTLLFTLLLTFDSISTYSMESKIPKCQNSVFFSSPSSFSSIRFSVAANTIFRQAEENRINQANRNRNSNEATEYGIVCERTAMSKRSNTRGWKKCAQQPQFNKEQSAEKMRSHKSK